MATPTVYLVSGANRGIGLVFVKQLAARDNVVVFAGARDPEAAKDLHALADKYPGRVHIVKLVSCDKAGNEAAVAEINKIAGRLDVVIANAGIFQYLDTALVTPLDEVRQHVEVNVVGVLALFQATYDLLNTSTTTPKFISITSVGGSIEYGAGAPMGTTAYGSSKAAQNYLLRKIHTENPTFIAFPISPGSVDTDMSRNNLKRDERLKAYEAMLITADQSVSDMLKQIDTATRESASGQFVDYTGGRLPW